MENSGNSGCEGCFCLNCNEPECGLCPARMHRCEECDN